MRVLRDEKDPSDELNYHPRVSGRDGRQMKFYYRWASGLRRDVLATWQRSHSRCVPSNEWTVVRCGRKSEMSELQMQRLEAQAQNTN